VYCFGGKENAMKRAAGITLSIVGALLCLGCVFMAVLTAGEQVGFNGGEEASRFRVLMMMFAALVISGWWLLGFAVSGALMMWGLELAKKPDQTTDSTRYVFEPPTRQETAGYVRKFEEFLKKEDENGHHSGKP
jgi:hypothetical protein